MEAYLKKLYFEYQVEEKEVKELFIQSTSEVYYSLFGGWCDKLGVFGGKPEIRKRLVIYTFKDIPYQIVYCCFHLFLKWKSLGLFYKEYYFCTL